MASKTKQSINLTGSSKSKSSPQRTKLEQQLDSSPFPELSGFLDAARKCDDRCQPFQKTIADAKRHPHPLVEIRWPVIIEVVYDAFEKHQKAVFDAEGDPGYLPELSGFIGWLVVSKLWRLCESLPKGRRYAPAMVSEIALITWLSELALRIFNSEERAQAFYSRNEQMRPAKATGKQLKANAKALSKYREREFYAFFDWCEEHARCFLSLGEAALAASETEIFPFSSFECYQMIKEHHLLLS